MTTNLINWDLDGAFALAIAGGASAPSLKNLADGSGKLGNEIDNTTDQDQYADWELEVRLASAPTAGEPIEMWFVTAAGGTNYEDGGDSVKPLRPPDVVFPVRAVATQQRITRKHILMPATKFKALIFNESGQAFTNTNDENELRYKLYNDQIQAAV